jgi:2,3-bisphosphoglycerate-independent phosphoglycerate mutase
MRYAIIIPDGAADTPCAELGGKTPLEAAKIPAMNRLAAEGILGLARTVPEGMKPGSDVANLAVLGYDPAQVYTGRAPLEAANMGIELSPDEAVFRANTVTIRDGVMEDYSAGEITSPESRAIIERFQEDHRLPGIRLVPGVSYRHACVMSEMATCIPERTPPHDITGKPVVWHNPPGEAGRRILELEELSRKLFPSYEENIKREKAGKNQATQLWLWGGGIMPELPLFKDLYGLTGGLVSAVDLLKGIAKLAGLEVIDVPGATGLINTNFSGKAQAALACLAKHDFVTIHLEAPDEAGHHGNAKEKTQALELIDKKVIAPLLAEADKSGDLRILCMPDHPTPIALRTHTCEPVPFVIWGAGISARGGNKFTEAEAAKTEDSIAAATGLLRQMMEL